MNRIIVIAGLITLFLAPAAANVKLPPIIADSMVLQQKSAVSIWGWAERGEKVRVKAGWLKSGVSGVADDSGRWKVMLKTGSAGGPYKITVEGTNRIVLKQILLGEVWVCSGQSNMEWSIKMLGGWEYFKGAERELRKNGLTNIRLCRIEKAVSEIPLDSCAASWSGANLSSVENFSATAYFFGRELYNKLHVPVGLISSSWGGTPAEAWTEKKCLESDSELNYYLEAPNSAGWPAARPSVLFNAMIHPILNYTIKGVIWYQGEANRNDADLYSNLFQTMIRNWRLAWNLGDFPFYYVQIAPYRYDEPFPSAAYLREAQMKALSLLNTGMVVTMDIGDVGDIHPRNKPEVGRRLALWALAKTYGQNVKAFSGPLYKSMSREGDKIRIYFENSQVGLKAKGGTLKSFAIAGSDLNFIPADALIEGRTVVVSSPGVPKPEAVRFAFTNTDSSQLCNMAGLPASSFRTDSIPFLVRDVKIVIRHDSPESAAQVSMRCQDKSADIHYTADGSDPSAGSPLYKGEIRLNQSTVVKARAYKGQVASQSIATAEFIKHRGIGKKLTAVNAPSDRYTGGENALLDGIRGSNDFRDGHWQGYEGTDVDCIIDLEDTLEIAKVTAAFLQNTQSWIFLPSSVEYSISADGIRYIPIGRAEYAVPPHQEQVSIRAFSQKVDGLKGRYLKVVAKNVGVCPPWHPGAGGKAWIFVDEIVIE